MAYYQILYWQDIPAQIKAWDDFDEIKIDLSSKFTAKIDQAAKEQGLISEDDYLSHWNWGEEIEYTGSAQEAGESVKKELENIK
ncbi:MAG TPA: virulence factor [Ignavibacteriaceae bacterium]|nr:virulence factor [Ignavibacteriaceae bacterium]